MLILAITFHMKRLLTGSIPVDGSSKNTIEGSPEQCKRKNLDSIKRYKIEKRTDGSNGYSKLPLVSTGQTSSDFVLKIFQVEL